MSARAAIVVTGTEVLTGRVADRNGPWLAERLEELGVDLAQVTIVGDRPADVAAALAHAASIGVDLVLTSGGLGPTADDLTASVVAEASGRELVLDEELEARIAEIMRPLLHRWPGLDAEAVQAANRKQAMVPRGATVLNPVGTAPGLVVPPAGSGPTIVVLPGPPTELQPMWAAAVSSGAFAAATSGATKYTRGELRLFGIPESELAATLRQAEEDGIELARLEITTCLRGGELEIVTRFEPDAEPVYRALEEFIGYRHADTLFSTDGRSVDQQVVELLLRDALTLAIGESCTGGLLASRLTQHAGASQYLRGAVVAYSDAVKRSQLGVSAELIELHGAVSGEVAEALAEGARRELGADVGIGITGIAGPSGGSAEKPVGLVYFCAARDGGRLTRRVELPGGREDVRRRSVTVALHILRRLLLGEME